MLKKILYIGLFALFTTGCAKKEGFAVRKITSSHAPNEKWETEAISGDQLEELKTLFDEPFYYLAKGCQSYAFVSADGKTVLKFFRQRRLGRHTWQNALPLPHSLMKGYAKKFEEGLAQREKEFSGYKEAFENLRDETGLVYLHLNPTHELLNKKVTLYYKNKRVDVIDIDKFEFVLQKRAILGFDHLEDLMKRGEQRRALNSICSFVNLIINRCQKGYADYDQQFSKNFGFINDQAIEIDIGYLEKDPSMKSADKCQTEVESVTEWVLNWFYENHPETLPRVKEIIKRTVNEKCACQGSDLSTQTLPTQEESSSQSD
ncbi:MAG: hypothetical protein SNF33_02880 [Candidatus Algichlamydia australiensis]|nr:hypothetical protein [Chlamydiales bacterium]